ncbi:hypothetical protein KMP13_11565 [Epibacterium ulvae]|uniref:hypothetical protein n=1 Tax=Epibacterium ulvae TaxID=1156985 RepID=UPI001BFC2EA3|nr:hypothetical protein [Epibacterium ulvae]MBT8154524.1 hypothetical protein [Epibacterium ulvae]
MSSNILVLGDSHCNVFIPALKNQLTSHNIVGGQLPLGPGWFENFHSQTAPLTFTRPEAQALFEQWVTALTGQQVTNILDVEAQILCSVTCIEHCVHSWMWTQWCPAPTPDRDFISDTVLDKIVSGFFGHILHFFELLTEAGHPVVNIVSPLPRDNKNYKVQVHDALRAVLHRRFDALGVPLIDVSDLSRDPETTALAQPYYSTMKGDKIHGSPGWGRLVSQSIVETTIFDHTS